MRTLLYFARAYPWRSLLMVLCLLLAGLAGVVGITTMLPLISLSAPGDTAPEQQSQLERSVLEALEAFQIEPTIGILLVLSVAAITLKAALTLLAKRQVGNTVAHVATDLRLELLRALLGTRWSYYTRQSVGEAANAIATEANRSSYAYHYGAQLTAFCVEALVYAGVAVALSWQTAVAATAVSGLMLLGLSVLVRIAGRAGRRQTQLLKSLLGSLTDVLQSVKMLKAMGREILIGPMLESDTRRLQKSLRRGVFSREAMSALQEPILFGFLAALLWVALVINQMAFSTVLVFLFLFSQIVLSLNRMQRKYQLMVTEASALWSLRGMIENANEHRETFEGTREPSLQRGIELRDVVLQYGERRVLSGVSLEIPAGEITAIVGPSGAGKTTIVDLLAGLVHPDAGEVRVDGTSLDELAVHRWRELIGYVPQEMLLLNDSVRFNVTLGDPEITTAQVEAALREASAWEFVAELPDGIDSEVGERGSLFSGGQRQRLSIARALLRQPKLLILDEATAALDGESEASVWRAIERLRGQTTVVAISHQATLVGIADRVYRIEDGTAERVSAPQTGRSSARVVA